MPQKDDMNTLSQIMNKLTVKGYDNEFRWTENGFCAKDKCYQPEDLTIVKTYRFEGVSDPSDMSILYLIKAMMNLLVTALMLMVCTAIMMMKKAMIILFVKYL